jgi:hypothetical protein
MELALWLPAHALEDQPITCIASPIQLIDVLAETS